MGELISRRELERSDSGAYFVSDAAVTRAPSLRWLDEAFEALVAANPDFDFIVEDRLLDAGKLIHWRRRPAGSGPSEGARVIQ